MKIPLTPPDTMNIMAEMMKEKEGVQRYVEILQYSPGPSHNGEYIHWDKLRHLKIPHGLSHKEYWLLIKNARSSQYKSINLTDKNNNAFRYLITDKILEGLLWIEKNSTGSILMDGEDTNIKMGNNFIYNSLVEEAISSSQLEGASTTRRVAKEMIKTNRKPRDKHEKMIFNNYYGMNFIKDIKNEDLTPEIIFEIHSLLTDGTFDEEDTGSEGQLRKGTDDICVFSPDDTLLHVPPKASSLYDRMQSICDFANQSHNVEFLPPVVKAIILHFMIGYDHPFVDGNGRTARALFYWYMAKHDYWLIEYISISRILKRSLTKYMYSYLHTETDDQDLTYFIEHQMNIIRKSIEELHDYLKMKTKQIQDTKELLRGSKLNGKLNYRQIQIVEKSLKNPGTEYTISQHRKECDISYQTARTDLIGLSEKLNLLRKRKDGKRDVFTVPHDIAARIEHYGKNSPI